MNSLELVIHFIHQAINSVVNDLLGLIPDRSRSYAKFFLKCGNEMVDMRVANFMRKSFHGDVSIEQGLVGLI